MESKIKTAPVPAAILSAAVGLLQPYAPNLTPDALSAALTTRATSEPSNKIEKALSINEVAAILNVSRATLSRWRATGRLHSVTISKRCVRIPAAEVRALMEA